jgi:hypothetical protein
LSRLDESLVAWGGIEPPTRGFSSRPDFFVIQALR